MTSHNSTGNSGGKLKLTGSHCVIMSWPVMTYQNTSQYQQFNDRGICLQWRVRLVNVEINPGVYLFPDSLICIGCVSVWAGIGSLSQSYSCLDWASLMCADSECLSLIADINSTHSPGAWSVSILNYSDWGLKEDTQEINSKRGTQELYFEAGK